MFTKKRVWGYMVPSLKRVKMRKSRAMLVPMSGDNLVSTYGSSLWVSLLWPLPKGLGWQILMMSPSPCSVSRLLLNLFTCSHRIILMCHLLACLFEIVSAYGTVGLSLGYPNVNASFSTEFGIVSKLVIIGMQIRGRHRGLPYELDRAILLPSESLHKEEDQDASKRMQRRMSNLSQLQADSAGMGMFPRQATGSMGRLSTAWENHVEDGNVSPSDTRGQQEKVERMSSNDRNKARSNSEEGKSSSREESADDRAADEAQKVEAALERGESKQNGRFFPRGELGRMMAGLANGSDALNAIRSKSREE